MDSFVDSEFVCMECNSMNPENDVFFDSNGDYEIVCEVCSETYRFGNVFEDKKYAAQEAYNDMVRGK